MRSPQDRRQDRRSGRRQDIGHGSKREPQRRSSLGTLPSAAFSFGAALLASLLGASLLGASLLAACGSRDSGAAPVPAFGGGPFAEGTAAADVSTVLVVALDGVRPGDIERPVGELPALPHFDSLRGSSIRAPEVFCALTGGNGAMATLLTGLHGREHGVISVRDLGRTRLDPSVPTLLSAFSDAGWKTTVSLPEGRLGRGVGGFARGADTFAAPRPGEPARTADSVLNAVEPQLAEALKVKGDRVFCLVCFSDLLQKTSGDLDPTEAKLAAPLIEARMAPFASKRAEVASALDRLRRQPAKAIEDFDRLFARSRGSAPAKAWHSARNDIELVRIDRALGRINALLESSGRASSTAVVVSGLRGRAEREAEARDGPRFQDKVIRVPLWLRLPGSQAPPLAPADTAAIAPFFADRFGLELRASAFESNIPRFARIAGSRGRLHALRTKTAHYERYPDGEIVVFSLDGRTEDGTSALDEAPKAALQAFAAPPTIEFHPAPDAGAFEAVWSLSDGSLVPRTGDRRPPPVRGRDALAETIQLGLTERATSVRLGLRGPGAAPSKLVVGQVPALELPLLYLPFEDGPPVAGPSDGADRADGADGADGAKPTVEIVRSAGLAWSLKVRGEGKADVLLSVWPPRDPSDGIQVPASNVRVSPVPGREDLVHLSGELPFDILVKKMGKEDFAIACRTEAGFVGPDAMAAGGHWFAGPDAFDAWLPAWQPAVSPELGDVTAALYGDPAPPASGSVTVSRQGYGPVPSAASALDFDALELLRTLPAGE